ncbi:MAG: hypothetical protein ACOYBY_03845 [Dermatophilaceae bacterium]
MTETIQSAAEFIAALPPLPPSLRATAVSAPSAPPDNQASASVAGNSLVAFTANLDGKHKTELLYVLGWAQQQALQNYHKSPQTDPVGYYQAVTDILAQVGFVAQDVEWGSYQTRSATVELDAVVLEILGELLTAPELAIVDAALKALEAAASDKGAPWTIYSSNSSTNKAGSFAVGLADETTAPDGTTNVSLKLCAFSFSGTEDNQRFLWISYSATSVSIQDGSTTVVLNDDLYNDPKVGGMIAAQMKALAASYIANLPPLKPQT